jgi:aconitate hydratase
VAAAVKEGNLVVSSVLSGNRNFEGRVHAAVKANYLASPPLVVAYALVGTTDSDLTNDPIGQDQEGKDVFLRDIWPTQAQVKEAMSQFVTAEMFQERYSNVFDGNERWNQMSGADGDIYAWDADNTYIQHPPFFEGFSPEPDDIKPISGARCLVMAGDSITTDHISPAGSIPPDSPAAKYLQERGVETKDFNSFGARRGNDRVMTRGTFGNVRMRNLLAPGTEGGYTIHLPTGEQTSIFEASQQYQKDGTPLVVLTGAEYGTGSSRDWAAKGTQLLGVKAVLATSYERIHRSNLIGMGVLPLQFKDGQTYKSLGLTGHEEFSIEGLDNNLKPKQEITVKAKHQDGRETALTMIARIDTPVEVDYYRHGGILPYVLRGMLKG